MPRVIPPSRESRHRAEADDLTVTSTAAPSVALDQLEERLVAHARDRDTRGLSRRERLAYAISAGGCGLGAIALCDARAGPRSPPGRLALFVGLYALVSRVEFEIGSGSAIPTQLVLVPMLFALPSALVPLWPAAGVLHGAEPAVALAGVHPPERLLVLLASASTRSRPRS